MPIIEFLANQHGAARAVEVPGGEELVDVCDHVLAPVPFSCRSASCATCQIEVLEGADLLSEPEPAERELLDILCAPGHHRLACQVKVRSGDGKIRLRPIE